MRSLCVVLFISFLAQLCAAQIIPAPKMECVQVSANGDIVLTWKESKPNACGNFMDYIIYFSDKKNKGYKAFPPIISRKQTTFKHAGANGNTTTWYYYIVANFDCAGYTSLSSDTVDNLAFAAPLIRYVSVDNENHALIRWKPSKGSNVCGYIIYYSVNNKNIPLDTVQGVNRKKFLDTIHNAGANPQSYSVACIDSCLDAGLISESQTSMLLTMDSISPCNQVLHLHITPYLGWHDSVAYYSQYVELPEGETVKLAKVSQNANLSFTDSYHEYANDSVYYYFYAVNKNGSDSARSNRIGINLFDYHLVRYLFLTNASVASSRSAIGNYYIDAGGSSFRIQIERAVTGLENYTSVINSYLPKGITGAQTFVDSSALTNQHSYTYRLVATDTCNVSDTSTLGNTMLLTGGTMSDGSAYLRWNPFRMDSFAELNYMIYKWDGDAFQLLGSVSPNTFEYIDLIKNISADSGHLKYLVTTDAQWNSKSFGLQKLTSSSNELDLTETPLIILPNAFRPHGESPLFKRVIINPYSISTYRFLLYDRWGNLIYQSFDYQSGWDGTLKGKLVPTGGYAWLVNTTLNNGNSVIRKGTFVVVY